MAKIVQVGCGYWGKNLTRNFAELGMLAGVVEGNDETAKRMSEAYNVPILSLDEALALPDVNGLSLATPATTHAGLGERVLKAGKHLFVEKPLALSLEDAELLISTADQNGVQIMVGHLLQYHPVFAKLKEMVQAGEIGDLRYIYSNRLSLGKVRVEENVMWSFAPHDISMLLSLVNQAPSEISAQGASFLTPGIADWSNVQFRFENGVRGHIQTSWIHPFKEQRLVVVGSKGMLVFEDSVPEWDKKLAFYPHGIDVSGPVPAITKAECTYIPVDKGEPLKLECQHFADVADNNVTSRTCGREGLGVLRVLTEAETQLQLSLERQMK